VDPVAVTLAHPTLATVYEVSQAVLDETWELLRRRGEEGLEAVVLWLGHVDAADRASVLGALVPPQIAYRSEHGLAVEIPQDVLTELIAALPSGARSLVRVHSHPTDAYHSELDDHNMVIGHEGAVSIVVPFFATGPVELHTCSINQLHGDGHWRELSSGEIYSRFAVR
jgi:hypothetical protein